MRVQIQYCYDMATKEQIRYSSNAVPVMPDLMASTRLAQNANRLKKRILFKSDRKLNDLCDPLCSCT